MATLPISDIVSVSVQVTPVSSVRAGFNLGLIIGTSAVISTADRVKVYSDLAAMVAEGFASDDPEYVAAERYFSQNPRPAQVAIGRWDTTGSETAVEAVTACRAKNTDWYVCTICGAVKADIVAVAAYIETALPASVFFFTTKDADVLAGTAGNVMLTLKAADYMRSLGQYSTENDAVASIKGYAMGANTKQPSSAYTLAYKSEPGVTPETLTAAQVTTLKNQNCNVYINRGNTYNLFEQGVMVNGSHFDEVLNLDMLTNNIQANVMDLLTSANKVPQTEGGVAQLVNAISRACDQAKKIGFLAPGVWNAAPILGLQTGVSLSQGYLVLADALANQSQADRAARKAPPIYVAIKEAGAIEHVVIAVSVNQ